MKNARIRAFFKEFPFVEKHVNPNEVTEAKVSRIDKDFLLNRAPEWGEIIERRRNVDYGWDIQVCCVRAEQLMILDREGELLSPIGGSYTVATDNRANKAAASWWNRLGMPDEIKKEILHPRTIEEALDNLREKKILDRAVFILSFIQNREYRKGDVLNKRAGNLVLYKPPKDFTLIGWLEEQERRECESIQKAVSTIDGEAIVKL